MSNAAYDDRAGPPVATYRFLRDRQPPRLPWLWPQRLPLNCLTLLIGDPGVGKSLLTADLAARLSVPLPWPDRPAAEHPDPAQCPPLPARLTEEDFDRAFPPIRGFPSRHILPTGVVFAAPEDATVLPDRLAAAGADPLHVSILDGVRPPFTQDLLPLRLPGHADQLERAINAHDHPRLVVLDPFHALLDDGVYCSPDLQAGLLGRLAGIARYRGVTILAVGHFSKIRAHRVFYRIRGSLSLAAAARSILLLTPDPDRPDHRILTQAKNAYGPLAPPLAFRIVTGPRPAPAHLVAPQPPVQSAHSAESVSSIQSVPCVPSVLSAPSALSELSVQPDTPVPSGAPTASDASAPHIEWDDPAGPDWRLATGLLDLSPESFSVLSETCDWLTDFLSAGPRPSREVFAEGRAAGWSRATLVRAKQLLNIASCKIGRAWTWQLKDGPDEDSSTPLSPSSPPQK